MTRGRKPEWADTPLAQWIRAHLERGGKDKKWLANQLAEGNAHRLKATAAQVNRWTFRGEPATAATLRDESVEALRRLFGEDPPGASDAARVHATLEMVTEALLNRINAELDARVSADQEVVGRLDAIEEQLRLIAVATGAEVER